MGRKTITMELSEDVSELLIYLPEGKTAGVTPVPALCLPKDTLKTEPPKKLTVELKWD